MGKRRKARECVLQILFQLEFAQNDLEEILKDYWAHQKVPAEVKEYSEWLARGICQHRPEIDQAIQAASKNWRLERMAIVDRNVLRIAVFEMLFEKTVAPPIIIDEAIEIAKKYSGQEAGVFVNGILDGIYRNLQKSNSKPEENGKKENNSEHKEKQEVKNE